MLTWQEGMDGSLGNTTQEWQNACLAGVLSAHKSAFILTFADIDCASNLSAALTVQRELDARAEQDVSWTFEARRSSAPGSLRRAAGLFAMTCNLTAPRRSAHSKETAVFHTA